MSEKRKWLSQITLFTVLATAPTSVISFLNIFPSFAPMFCSSDCTGYLFGCVVHSYPVDYWVGLDILRLRTGPFCRCKYSHYPMVSYTSSSSSSRRKFKRATHSGRAKKIHYEELLSLSKSCDYFDITNSREEPERSLNNNSVRCGVMVFFFFSIFFPFFSVCCCVLAIFFQVLFWPVGRFDVRMGQAKAAIQWLFLRT